MADTTSLQIRRLHAVFLLLVFFLGTVFYHVQYNSPMKIDMDISRLRPKQLQELQTNGSSHTSHLNMNNNVIYRNMTQWNMAVYTKDQTKATSAVQPVPGKGTCKPHLNAAFMKIHKCGSSLISGIFFRFGYKHNLIVALPRQKGLEIIGSFGTIKDDDYVHPPGGKRWNIFAHHAMYNRTRFRQLMAPNTRYVAILREPLERLKSAFSFFHLQKTFPGLKEKTLGENAYVTTYLSRPSYWEPRYQPPEDVRQREHACFRNCMARDLGLAEREYDNRTAVEEFVQGIENDFHTVLILEYLPASLILLKRRMCWTFYDILYTTAGLGNPARLQNYRREANITDTMKRTFYQHNYADVLLYTRYNETFHRQIRQEGADFQEEVNHFTRVNNDVCSYCQSEKRQKGGDLVVKKSRWNDAFSVNKLFCERYGASRRYVWDRLLRSRYGLTGDKGLEKGKSSPQKSQPKQRRRFKLA